MTSGLILLGLIALLAAYGWHRVRRRLGMPVSFRIWLIVIAVVVIALLASWSLSGGH